MQFKDVSLSFGEHPLLDKVSFQVNPRDRIAIIGRNGVGKSTLLKLMTGEISPDSGSIERQGAKIGQMVQHVPNDLSGTIFELVASAHESDEEWQVTHQVDSVISQLGLNPDAELTSLSGGQIRRALLAQALVNEPDILLLDEPTNHLDLDSIQWLEKFLLQYHKAIVLITHDRFFMQRVANRIIEIDRGNLISWDGDYHGFLKHKEQQLAAEATFNKNFDKKLAEEEVWIRQGIKARRTRNEGRVRALKALRLERAARRDQLGKAKLEQQQVQASGKHVFELNNISASFDDKKIINRFSTLIQRGDKIGIIGPNGSGKTTLLSIMLGELTPDTGTVKLGSKLDIAYFDQHREALDPESTALDNIAEGKDSVEINGKSKHVLSYLRDFLFTPQKARSKVKSLSGGERNRLLLAKLFAKNSNVLVLDEPTNDLDMETLELLEEYLVNYEGTVLLVSHDREFLNNVVTSTIVFEGNARLQEYIGGYDDWQRQKQPEIKAESSKPKKVSKPKTKKLNNSEHQELKKLPRRIEKLEATISALELRMAEPEFYQQEPSVVSEAGQQLKIYNQELEALYARWEELM